jgi:drug/metabolite transporter (DMT)-like permease
MTTALLAAVTAAVCYGVASVLQAIGANKVSGSLVGVTRSLPYLLGVALDIAGFLVSTVALRRLPLFSVQAIVASSVVVTAALAIPVLGTRMRRPETLAVATVCTGLVLLGLSSSGAPAHAAPQWVAQAALVAVVFVAVTALIALRSNVSGPPIALLAGLAFGLVGLSVRLLEAPSSLLGWFADPATFSLALAGALALLLYAAALQRWRVTSATAVVVALDTLVPASIGLLFLGDRAAPGRGLLAAAGFATALGGAVVLSRLGAGLCEIASEPGPSRTTVAPDTARRPGQTSSDDVNVLVARSDVGVRSVPGHA